jgi:hypothetical protein
MLALRMTMLVVPCISVLVVAREWVGMHSCMAALPMIKVDR